MDEQFLQYVWKYQKFDGSQLTTADGRSVTVFDTGNHNFDSGPDFEEARIKIGEIEWAGHVEVHQNASDWNKHKHSSNQAYQNVILHVVWKNDESIHLNGNAIPTLELKSRVDPRLIEKYQLFIKSNQDILCANSLPYVPSIVFDNMIDKATSERLALKSQEVLALLAKYNNDWEEVTYQLLTRSFGFSINKPSFEALAESLPLKTILKYKSQTKSLEALLFGQAGFLVDPVDEYQANLKLEYQYLSKKHRLENKLSRSSWKFGRMRPANFPTVRIVQFASLLSKHPHFFSMLIKKDDPKEIIECFNIDLSDYWKRHYDFGKPRSAKSNGIGKNSREIIVINTICPLLFAYSKYTDNQSHADKAIHLLELIAPEKNRITKKWELVGKKAHHAFDSQGLIALYKSYCQKRKCLQCNVGFEIMKS